MEKLLTTEEKKMLPSDLVWDKTEESDEFTYRVEAYDQKNNTLYIGYCDKGEYDILDWRFANLDDDIYAEILE
jgi:protein-tyrosine phosphatase